MNEAALKFSKDHIWIQEEDGGIVTLGISDYAQKELKAVMFLNLPEAGEELVAGRAFGDVESLKTVVDLISPVDGEVCEVNESLLDEPELLNAAPYEHWMLKAHMAKSPEGMMDISAYTEYVEKGCES